MIVSTADDMASRRSELVEWVVQELRILNSSMNRRRYFLFTFTYDHNKYTIDETNTRVSNDLKKMRTYIHRIFNSKFGTITSYESTKSGYPAPHFVVRLDRLFPVFSHLNIFRN